MEEMRDSPNIFGGAAQVQPALHFDIGAISFDVDGNGLRSILWGGVEVLKGLSAPVRDKSWGTLEPEKITQDVRCDGDTLRIERTCSYLSKSLNTDLAIVVTAQGTIRVTNTATSTKDIEVNRVGFCLLHPVNGVAGTPVEVSHGSGVTRVGHFPTTVEPAQPFTDICALSHQIGSALISIQFSGEQFEMEDQRNWSDASFKTYCRPLAKPFPYLIKAGEASQQSIDIQLKSVALDAVLPTTSIEQDSFRMPDILSAVQAGWLGSDACVANGQLLRISAGDTVETLKNVASTQKREGHYTDVEIVVPDGCEIDPFLTQSAADLAAAGVDVRHVIALPEAYLKSYQPSGPWPSGASPSDCLVAVARVFPNAAHGVGMLTNFTELNRCPPSEKLGSYLTHGNAAIVHAADDLSVLETLEAIPHILSTGIAIAGARDYRLGLMAIAMRTNPYGTTLDRTSSAERRTMTSYDPRQKGLFAAAYAVALTYLAGQSGVEAIALASPQGPFGIRNNDGSLRPIFHVVKALAESADQEATPIADLPTGLWGLQTQHGTIIANCSLNDVTFDAPVSKGAILDAPQFDDAAQDTNWLSNGQKTLANTITLGPCGCLFSQQERLQ